MKAQINKVLPSLGNEVIIIRNLECKLQDYDRDLPDKERINNNKEMIKVMSVGALFDLAEYIASKLYELPSRDTVDIIKEALDGWSNEN